MKDYQLYLVVATLVLIDVITMTAWQILDPFFRETKELLPEVKIPKLKKKIPKSRHNYFFHLNIFRPFKYLFLSRLTRVTRP